MPHKANSYYTLAISCGTFCVGKYLILGPEVVVLGQSLIEPVGHQS